MPGLGCGSSCILIALPSNGTFDGAIGMSEDRVLEIGQTNSLAMFRGRSTVDSFFRVVRIKTSHDLA